MKKQSRGTFLNIGSVSLLVVFLVLVLSSFAALSVSTAKNDYDLSEKLAEHNTAYYNACSMAEDFLAEIKSSLLDASDKAPASDKSGLTSDLTSEYNAIAGEIAENDKNISDFAIDFPLLSFCVNINDGQALSVSAEFDTSGNYKIISWQSISTSEWNGDDSVDLIN